MVGVVAAAAMAVEYGYTTWDRVFVDWRHSVYGAGTLLLTQIGSNMVNQGTDVAEDRVNRGWRPVPSGMMSSAEALSLGHLLWFAAILRAATLSLGFGVLVTLVIMVSYTYSTPPFRLKQHPWFGNLGIATARGLLGFIAAWALFAPISAPQPWVAGSVLYLYLLGAATSKDFADEAGDRAAGVRTLVVEYGAKKAAWMSLPFAFSPIFLVPLLSAAGYIHVDVVAYLLASLLVLMFCWSMLFQPHHENKTLEATRPWTWNYVALLGLMLMFAFA